MAGGGGSDVYAYPELAMALEYGLGPPMAMDILVDPANGEDRDVLDLGEVDQFNVKTLFAGCLEVVNEDFDADGQATDMLIGGAGPFDSIQVIGQFEGDGSGLELVRIGNGPGEEDDLVLKIQQGLEGTYEDEMFVGASQEQGLEWIRGGDGQDFLFGNGGRDRLLGGDDDDALFGGRNNDRLFDGEGKDFLAGGGDEDLFVFRPDATEEQAAQVPRSFDLEIGWVPDGFDVVYDFEVGVDKVVLQDYLVLTEATTEGSEIEVCQVFWECLETQQAVLAGVNGTLVTIPYAVMVEADATEFVNYELLQDQLFLANVAPGDLSQEDFEFLDVIG